MIAQRGAGQSGVFARWPEIVGDAAAQYLRPIEFQWPKSRAAKRQESDGATLLVAVDSAYSLEGQFAADRIVAAVNAHLGWKCVRAIAFRQERFAEAATKKAPPPIDRRDADRIDEAVKPIEDEALRETLFRLGIAIAARAHERGGR